MCYHTKQTADAVTLQNRFDVKIEEKQSFKSVHFNGFDYPATPVITNDKPEEIQLFNWGLIPAWAKSDFEKKNTLNARIETLSEKPSFKNVLHQKCLVIVDGFYDFQHLESGKKQRYLLSLPDNEPFALAGLWSIWQNLEGVKINTYTIITTEAQGIMREIHNSKLRQPVILPRVIEKEWLFGKCKSRLDHRLIATPA